MLMNLNIEPSYSFAVTGLKVKSRTFSSEFQAKQYMYEIISKNNLSINKVYDDGPYKTFVCTNDVRFYIQRA